mgnify:FL=1
MIEEHLLTLILQSPDPVSATAIVTRTLQDVTLGSREIQGILEFLRIYFLTSTSLNIAEISLKLSPDLTHIFDLCLLTPFAPLPTDEAYLIELEKLARDVKNLAIRERLKMLSEKIKNEEKNGESEALSAIEQEFDALMTHLKT